VDFIPKPSGVISYDIEKLGNEIIAKVEASAGINVHKIKPPIITEIHQPEGRRPAIRKKLVVIGASTGGPKAIVQILSGLPREIPAAIIAVQHMSPEFTPPFVDRLSFGCPLRISVAQKGEPIQPGRVLIAPGGYHTIIVPNGSGNKIRLSRRASPQYIFPSIDYTMESAARAYGESTLGVLLTGLGSDGVQGLKAIKEAGGCTMAQDESTCVIFGMPKAAIEAGCVDEIVPLPRIAHSILQMI
jgi:two-component system chemotaxis response regulator CheB